MEEKKLKKFLIFLSMVILFNIQLGQATANNNYEDINTENLLTFIEDFLDRRTSAMTEETDSILLLKSSNGQIKESEDIFSFEKTTLAELDTRRDVLKQWGEAYSHHITKINLKNKEMKNGAIVLDIEEYTELYYKKVTGEEPEYTAWVSERQFIFEKLPTGQWNLISQQLLNPNGPTPMNEPTGITREEMNQALTNISTLQNEEDNKLRLMDELISPSSAVIQGSFSRTKARDYALKYWKNYNNNYRKFDNDCTNFISQAMYAGGWTHKSGFYRDSQYWWYNSLNQSWSWIGVPYWHDFALKHSKRTVKLSSPRSLWEGEVLQVDFTNNGVKDHTMIVTKKTSSEIYLTYHTNDTLNRSFASISVTYPKANWVPHMVKISY